MLLSEFLTQLSAISALHVRYVQGSSKSDQTNQQIFVGCGAFPTNDHIARGPSPFLLTNKGIAGHFGLQQDFSSVTKLIANPPDGFLETLSLWQRRFMSPQDVLSVTTIVADDASPDSIFAVLLLLARLAGVDIACIPPAWVEAIDHWEVTGLAADREHSWCVLESALTHRNFPLSGDINDECLAEAWMDGLRFAAYCLGSQSDPNAIRDSSLEPQLVEAKAAFLQERDLFGTWLQRATQLQLVLPLQGTKDRQTLVDGLFVESRQVTGITKTFFRTDSKNSPLKRGFAFSAIYTPVTGSDVFDITISVDPSTGLHLNPLRDALEEAEDAAWQKAGKIRPADNARPLQGHSNSYNEPWFITPNSTLIGRPHDLPSGQPGSLLPWNDVREIIWRTFNPLRQVTVRALDTETITPLLELQPEGKHASHAKLFFAARWIGAPENDSMVMPPVSSPYLPRILAAIVKRGRGRGLPRFHDLPPLGSWKLVALSSGLLVTTQSGVFLLDDASAERLNLEEIRSAFHHASELNARLGEADATRLQPLAASLKRLLCSEKPLPAIDSMLSDAAMLGTELAEMKGSLAMLPDDPDARLLRISLETEWLLERRLAATESQIHTIEASLRSLNELRTLRIGRFIATYGFAIVLASSIAPFAAKAAFNALHGGADVDAPGRSIVLWFLGLVLFLSTAMGAWFGWEDPLRRRHS